MIPEDQIPAKATQPNGWASRPLSVDRANVLSAHYRAYPVELIATFTPHLFTCRADEKVINIATEPTAQSFDFLPVTIDDQIVGLFDRVNYAAEASGTDERSVMDLTQRISERILISSETSLLTFIADAREASCRLVLRDTRIDGIVTISDLQKLPVRPALFLLITYVELLLADVLKAAGHTENDRWLGVLSDARKESIEEKWSALKISDMEVDKLIASQFCDKRKAVIKLIRLPVSKSVARDELKEIEELRDYVAHAGDYAATKDAALRTIDTVRLAERWIDRLESVLTEIEQGRAGA